MIDVRLDCVEIHRASNFMNGLNDLGPANQALSLERGNKSYDKGNEGVDDRSIDRSISTCCDWSTAQLFF
jgi:hypothetical protein